MELLILSDTTGVKRSNGIYKVRAGERGAEWIRRGRRQAVLCVSLRLKTPRCTLSRLADIAAVILFFRAIKQSRKTPEETERSWNLTRRVLTDLLQKYCIRIKPASLAYAQPSNSCPHADILRKPVVISCETLKKEKKENSSEEQLWLQAATLNHRRAALIFHFCWTPLSSSTGGREQPVKHLFQPHVELHNSALCCAVEHFDCVILVPDVIAFPR